jgi:aldehyde dehydrogenase (NAD+)
MAGIPAAESVERIETRNPASPDDVVSDVEAFSNAQLDDWLSAADSKGRAWESQAVARSAALQAWADRIEREAARLAALVCDEVGKPISEARSEVARTVAIVRYFAQAAFEPNGAQLPGPTSDATIYVEQRPVGVVAAICPWNFPLAIPAWKIAPALAYGNAVAFKPSSKAVGAAHRLVELARPDIPAEVLVFAPMSTVASQQLLRDARIGAGSFTGSGATGEHVISQVTARGASVQAEMGGQNASVVLDDAELERSARTIAGSAMAYAGQKCTATSRVIVQRAIAPQFVDCLVAEIDRMQPGDPRDAGTVVGPVIDAAARDAVEASVASSVRAGARVLTGGGQVPGAGWFVRPTLLEVSESTDKFVQEETFGPVAALMIVDSDEQAIRLANGTRYGLAGAVFSQDVDRATSVARQLTAGMIRVNGSTTGADFWAPFGGDGASSFGPREQGRAARDFYTSTRTLTIFR